VSIAAPAPWVNAIVRSALLGPSISSAGSAKSIRLPVSKIASAQWVMVARPNEHLAHLMESAGYDKENRFNFTAPPATNSDRKNANRKYVAVPVDTQPISSAIGSP
jgi:hypothetical protein